MWGRRGSGGSGGVRRRRGREEEEGELGVSRGRRLEG